MKFNDDNKQVNEFSDKYFSFGVHKLAIGSIELSETENGKEYIEVLVMDPEDGEITDTARVWFTTPAATNYSFNVLRQIYVHNAPDDKKDDARAAFDAVEDTTKLIDLLQKLTGGEIWFTKYYDLERTYEAKDGKIKPSVNKNIYGYEPKLKPELMPSEINDLTLITSKNIDKIIPGAKEIPFESPTDAPGSVIKDANSGIPASDDWSK